MKHSILCRLGLHRWNILPAEFLPSIHAEKVTHYTLKRECKRCGKEEILQDFEIKGE